MLPHRDSKDVFILGGIDDIQALLDDSMVKIALSLFVRHTVTRQRSFLGGNEEL